MCGNGFGEDIRIAALVGHDESRRLVLDQLLSLLDICELSREENGPQRIAQSIDGDMQLGGQSAAQPTDFLTARFFGRQQNTSGHERWLSR